MDKVSFERELKKRLSDLPENVSEMYVGGYRNIIEGMTQNGLTEEQAVASLGSPDVLSVRIHNAAGGSFTEAITRKEEPENRDKSAENYGDGFNENDDIFGGYNSEPDVFSEDASNTAAPVNAAADPVTAQATAAAGSAVQSESTASEPQSVAGVNDPLRRTSGMSAGRVVVIVALCIIFLPVIFALYISAVSLFISGLTLFGTGFVPLFSGAVVRGFMMLGVGLFLTGMSILMIMGLNRLFKLVTGQYRLMK